MSDGSIAQFFNSQRHWQHPFQGLLMKSESIL
jgi:hypothetical protein